MLYTVPKAFHALSPLILPTPGSGYSSHLYFAEVQAKVLSRVSTRPRPHGRSGVESWCSYGSGTLPLLMNATCIIRIGIIQTLLMRVLAPQHQ